MLFNYVYGLRTSLIVTLAVVIALVVDTDDPWWAGMSAMTVANADWTNVWRKGMQRILGTIIGGFGGYWIGLACKNYEFFQWLAVAGFASLAVYKRMASPNYAYACSWVRSRHCLPYIYRCLRLITCFTSWWTEP